MDSGIIVGCSGPMIALKRQISKVAKVDYSLLITGESGSGKELVARSVHASGARVNGPFVPVNAASIPVSLLEPELFGYVRGAFTDAVGDRKGLIEEADEGTLFLDEIGELPAELQSKLLRVLQEREVKRVGENRYRKVDIRLISATNRDLNGMMDTGRFREDLFYRIQDLVVGVPPLRERKEDIPLLIDHFIQKHRFRFSPEHIPFLYNYCVQKEWKGNVRELESFMKRAHTYYPEFNFSGDESDQPETGLLAMKRNYEQAVIQQVLTRNGWNKTRSARELKISRTYLFNLIRKYRISAPGKAD